MQRCLVIPDITELICEHVQVRNWSFISPVRNPDVAALARTCKDFQDPALDILWKKQDTLAHILKCLPSHLWEEPQPRQIRLIRPVLPADWERPLFYARRVRELNLPVLSRNPHEERHIYEPPFPGPDVLDTISSTLPQKFLCPNLQSISWGPKQDSIFPYIRQFLSPKITAAYLRLPTVPSANIALLSTLTLRYSELKTLRIWSKFQEDPLLCRTLSTMALDLLQIETLHLDGIDRAALEHLSQLPHLRSLGLYSPAIGRLGMSSTSHITELRHHSFPALRAISFTTTFDFAIEFVDMFSNAPLDSVSVLAKVLATGITTSQPFTSLATHIAHTALHQLTVRNEDGLSLQRPPPGTTANYVVNGNTLASLFCFRHLTIINLTPPVGFDIDDATAWDMACAWPKIRKLRLGSASGYHPAGMSLQGLRAFATHCKDLSYLEITVDASTVPDFDNPPEASTPQHALQTFDVPHSPISDPPAVARFLSGLFPNLRTINYVSNAHVFDVLEYAPVLAHTEEMLADFARYNLWGQVTELIRT
ncbi:hypothetical protein DFH09DRAFT_1290314 [Mycena vulgaris]|nr:hypothetical protein DFH09DRAFT_1290314 [Mycena vulgaris]